MVEPPAYPTRELIVFSIEDRMWDYQKCQTPSFGRATKAGKPSDGFARADRQDASGDRGYFWESAMMRLSRRKVMRR